MRFVLDASVTCAWYLKNQATDNREFPAAGGLMSYEVIE